MTQDGSFDMCFERITESDYKKIFQFLIDNKICKAGDINLKFSDGSIIQFQDIEIRQPSKDLAYLSVPTNTNLKDALPKFSEIPSMDLPLEVPIKDKTVIIKELIKNNYKIHTQCNFYFELTPEFMNGNKKGIELISVIDWQLEEGGI